MTTPLAAVPPTSAAPPRHLLTLDELGPGGLRSLLDLTGRLNIGPIVQSGPSSSSMSP